MGRMKLHREPNGGRSLQMVDRISKGDREKMIFGLTAGVLILFQQEAAKKNLSICVFHLRVCPKMCLRTTFGISVYILWTECII